MTKCDTSLFVILAYLVFAISNNAFSATQDSIA